MLSAAAPSPRSELNKFIELWRYPDATACMNARIAAREAPEWRAAIAKVAPMVQVRARKQPGKQPALTVTHRHAPQSFSTQFLNPVAWSPWQ